MVKFSAIVLAGGIGKRMGRSIPKQLLLLKGKPMIMHSVEKLDVVSEVDEIIVTCPTEFMSDIRDTIRNFGIAKKTLCIDGGVTRQESVHNALRVAANEHVLLHEAARPFVSVGEFQTIVSSHHKYVTYATKIPFTVSQGTDRIIGLLDRDTLLNIQLPQKFPKSDLLRCHELARVQGRTFTEDSSMIVHYLNETVQVLEGTEFNIKVTTPLDMAIGEILQDEILGRR